MFSIKIIKMFSKTNPKKIVQKILIILQHIKITGRLFDYVVHFHLF